MKAGGREEYGRGMEREGNVQVVSLRRGEECRKKEKGKKKKRKEKKRENGESNKKDEGKSRSGSQMEDPAIRT